MGICETSKNIDKCNGEDLKNNNIVNNSFEHSNFDNKNVEKINTLTFINENNEINKVQVIGRKNDSSKFVTIEFINKVKASVCKIKCDNKSGTGFFMNIPLNDKTFRYLITNNNVINKDLIKKIINLEIHNRKDIKLLLDNKIRDIHFLPEKSPDITAIQIIEEDYHIMRNAYFLNYDKNYSQGYNVYINQNVFTLGYAQEMSIGIGKIRNIENYEFYHDIPKAGGYSCSPIINSKTIEVIGIHKGFHGEFGGNIGSFIGRIVDEIQNYNSHRKISLKKGKENFIVGEIEINEYNVNQEIPIICSFHQKMRGDMGPEFAENIDLEEEMKNCEIEIEDIKIPFSYTHKFTKIGNYKIIYSFKKYLTDLRYMFNSCSYITYLDLSKFNTKNVSDMGLMFDGCSSLTEIKLNNLDTEKVINMSGMFGGCKILTNLDLSSFNTKNVTDMNSMFFDCQSLKNINLSSFNTENVTNMWGMFFHCSSLLSLDLSFFNTINVTNMSNMFYGCSSLKDIDLSSFNTKNVTEMCGMFFECTSLGNLDLSNFNTENVKNMSYMFCRCISLLHLNLSNFNTQNVTIFGIKFGNPILGEDRLINLPSFFSSEGLSNMFIGCSPLLFQNIEIKDKNLLETINNIYYDSFK